MRPLPLRTSAWFLAALLVAGYGALASAQQPPTPPHCCGDACGPGNPCCPGAVCSTTGRCVPSACAACGDRGCNVDFTTCEVTCGRIQCCLETCATDTDCCTGTECRGTSAGRRCIPEGCDECTARGRTCEVAGGCQPVCGALSCCRERCRTDRDCCGGTSCQPVLGGDRLCLPRECDECGNMTPHCQVDQDCNPSCVPDESCGRVCNRPADCGSRLTCREFASGRSLCVPTVFERLCEACGTGGCHFEHDACAVVCGPPSR